MMRPIDLQTTLLSAQNVPAAAQRAQEGPRMEAAAAQAAFAAELTRRDESVAALSEAAGNRVGAKLDEREPPGRRKRRTPTPFEQVVDEAAGSAEEPPHIVDFTA